MKKRITVISLISLFVILLIILPLTVSISGEPWMAGGAVCISFDKWDMRRADKIIIDYHGKTYTVTDPEFIKVFSEETLSGTYSDYCCSHSDDGKVKIYRGDRLVRRMRYIVNHDAFAYESDLTHWVFFGKEGHSFLSEDTGIKLREITGS